MFGYLSNLTHDMVISIALKDFLCHSHDVRTQYTIPKTQHAFSVYLFHLNAFHFYLKILTTFTFNLFPWFTFLTHISSYRYFDALKQSF